MRATPFLLSLNITTKVIASCFLLCCQQHAWAEAARNLIEPTTSSTTETRNSCAECKAPRPFDQKRHKKTYTIGVLDPQGLSFSYTRHNDTFSTYLTATAGQRFDPPISFQMIAVDFQSMFDVSAQGVVDFVYVNPSAFACIEAEYGAQSLVSHIAKRNIGGTIYELSSFAGVIVTRANNNDINLIKDLKGKIVGAAAISAFGGGQMQFREMQRAGLSYINDPKQLVFTNDQSAVVNGVINGDFEVGLVRTDQIERTKDANGNLIDPSVLKILEPKVNFVDGEPFPFTASTRLYPEWNFAAMKSIPADVALEVQAAMLSLAEFSKSGEALEECRHSTAANKNSGNNNDTDSCILSTVVPQARCDTTEEIAKAAYRAMTNGGYATFRTTQSYIDIRAMLQDTDFISFDKDANVWRCVRPNELYDAITCPPEHFKKSKLEVATGCADSGLKCNEGYQCVCNPCVKAFDVDVYSQSIFEPSSFSGGGGGTGSGCPKMSVCGTMVQNIPLEFHVVDNLKRDGATVEVTVHEGVMKYNVTVDEKDQAYEYKFDISSSRVGFLIFEIKINGEQIPESPLRVEVTETVCDSQNFRTADENGDCVCTANSIEMGENCVPFSIFLGSIFITLATFFIIGTYMYIARKYREADSVWYIKQEDLLFGSPAQVIGQGSFGSVFLAEYRGTKVAVKRSISQSKTAKSRSGSVLRSSSRKICETIQMDIHGGIKSMAHTITNNSKESQGSTSTTTEQNVDEEAGVLHSEYHIQNKNGIQEDIKLRGMRNSRQSSREVIYLTKGSPKQGRLQTVSFSSRHKSRNWFLSMKKSYSSEVKQKFIKEMRLLSKLRHPCVTTIMGAVMEKVEEPLLVMEYMENGSLYDIIHNESMFMDGEMLLHILRDITQGIRFLHSSDPPVIHGDLKSSNILVDSKFRAKICDFGLSLRKNEGARGSPLWMAPELLRGDSSNTTASDMYALGIILCELYSRKDPYEGEDIDIVIKQVCDKGINKRPRIPSSCPPKISKLIRFLLLSEPKTRPTAQSLNNRVIDLEESDVAPRQMTMSHQLKKIQSKQNSTDVLYQVFPQHIADVLQSGGKVEPETHDCVTIFFSDIVGFTKIASACDPMKVSTMLDRLYTGFDELTSKHDLFKIETIGDAYMCAGNLARDQRNDHVKRIAQFAIEVVATASKVLIDEDDPESGFVQIRVGFHTGPVVSNVVGSLNPRYGIFGDTVNVSSRMESTSMSGRIQCSEASAKLLMKQAPEIFLQKNGEVDLKGRGKMMTYWVVP